MRTAVYVDGLNLYYCKLRQNPEAKWLDLHALARRLLPDDEIVRVRYFTARVSNKPDPQAPRRQAAYLRALKAIGGVDLHFGRFTSGEDRMPLFDTKEVVSVLRTEEKRSDVNIAVHMVLDAVENVAERVVLVSNDADLRLPLRVLQGTPWSRDIWVFNPATTKNNDLKIGTHLDLKLGALLACQMPGTVVDVVGRETHRPGTWRKRGEPHPKARLSHPNTK